MESPTKQSFVLRTLRRAAGLLPVVLLMACSTASQPTASPTQVPTPPRAAPTATAAAAAKPAAPTAAPTTAQSKPGGSPSPAPATPTRPPSPSPATFDATRVTFGLEPAWQGFAKPLGLANAGDGSGRMFVVEQGGLIRVVEGGSVRPQPFIDLRTQVSDVGGGYSERGLLGLAFHPRYRENGLFFVNYTDKQGHTQVVRYRVSNDKNVADAASARTILTQQQPYPNHNGGHLAFGPDGYLYVGLGDGGSANDPQGNGQNLGTLLGKMLRIDVNVPDGGPAYAVPADNPFRDRAGARPEVWAFGLRNPWRYSFDRANGDLYIADVGQNAFEEVNVQPGRDRGGQNYGWNRMEGAHCRGGGEACDRTGLTMPVAEYARGDGCSVTGGYVYRGAAQPLLTGAYFYGDYCSGQLWALARRGDGQWAATKVLQRQGVQVSSFGEDEAGELYLTSLGEGVVYRLTGVAR